MTATGLTRRTLLIDAPNLLVRSVFAMRGSPLSADGVPTGALHTFILMLSRYIRAERPDNVVATWDGGRSVHRTALYDGYKAARREPGPDEPLRPFAQAKAFCTLAGIHQVEHLGVEADDLIAAYWRGKHSAERVTILSADKDFLQLLDGWAEQIRPGTGVNERWTANRVRTEMGCKAEQIPAVMALTGDAIDGISGIPGFGTRTAVKMLLAHDWDLERVIAHGVHRGLPMSAHAVTIRRNLALVDLRTAIPGIDVAPAPRFVPTTPSSAAFPLLDRFLDRYELNAVRARLVGGTLWTDPLAQAVAPAQIQGDLGLPFRRLGSPDPQAPPFLSSDLGH